MGKVRTEQIKRIAKELLRQYPDKFSNNFEDNKRIVNMLVRGSTRKIRNRIAGYVTHIFVGTHIASSSEDLEEKE